MYGSSAISFNIHTHAGFSQTFASWDGAWGEGTYYSTRPALAMRYGHQLATNRELKQILAVDVLTGRSTHLSAGRKLRNPPVVQAPHLVKYALSGSIACLALSQQHAVGFKQSVSYDCWLHPSSS